MIVDCAVYRDGVRLGGDRTPESVAGELSTPPPDEHEPGGAGHDPAEGGYPACPLYTLTGYWCPGCGLTRATDLDRSCLAE